LKALKKGTSPSVWSSTGRRRCGLAEAFNDVADLLEHSTRETARIATVVGKEGRITQRANIGTATGSWADRIDSLNT
jgi:hypothetical protein